MIFAFLALCLASEADNPPAAAAPEDPLRPDFGAPKYVTAPDFLISILLTVFFVGVIFFISYPRRKLAKYQRWLISVLGPALGAYHFLGIFENNFPLMVSLIVGIVAAVLSMRKEFQAFTLSVANAYFGGYLLLMFFSIGVRIIGIPLLIIFFLFDYYFLSFIEPLCTKYAVGSACTFLFLCAIYNFFDAFEPLFMLTTGFLEFKKTVARIVFFVTAVFFYVVYPFAAKSILRHFFGEEPSEEAGSEKPAAEPPGETV